MGSRARGGRRLARAAARCARACAAGVRQCRAFPTACSGRRAGGLERITPDGAGHRWRTLRIRCARLPPRDRRAGHERAVRRHAGPRRRGRGAGGDAFVCRSSAARVAAGDADGHHPDRHHRAGQPARARRCAPGDRLGRRRPVRVPHREAVTRHRGAGRSCRRRPLPRPGARRRPFGRGARLWPRLGCRG